MHGDGNWLGIEYGGFEFLRGLGWGPKMSLFARSDLHEIQYGAKTENDIKNRKLSCSGQIISLPNGENRAKIRKGDGRDPLAHLGPI